MIDRLWRLTFWVAYRVMVVYWFVRRPTEPSAHVAVWWSGRVLITRSSYRSYASLPAGGLKRGETTVGAARRELAEEVGIRVAEQDLRPAFHVSCRQQFKRDVADVFELDCDREPRIEIDRREIVRAWFEQPRRRSGSSPRHSSALRGAAEGVAVLDGPEVVGRILRRRCRAWRRRGVRRTAAPEVVIERRLGVSASPW